MGNSTELKVRTKSIELNSKLLIESVVFLVDIVESPVVVEVSRGVVTVHVGRAVTRVLSVRNQSIA